MSATDLAAGAPRHGGQYRVAADIGGTFTDIACLSPDGELLTRKVSSTPDDYARAIVTALDDLARERSLDGPDFAEVLHASTVATNAILESKGARTALVTTQGFRDVLELRRIRVPRLYEPLYEKPAPLVPRRLRFEVSERMDARGDVLKPLDLAAVGRLAERLSALDIDAVAICFLHAHVNPAHERQVAEILRRRLPNCFVSVSHEVLPEIREYERTSTTVANAYIGPAVANYLRSLSLRLTDRGITGRLLMMQSSGGTLDLESVIAKPATVVESGPAAGVVGAAHLGALAGYRDIISFDMGGTTAKAALIEDGKVVSTDEYEVGGGISLSSRLVKGGGYALKLPVIDVSEVGAGGGSLVRIDGAGALKVGPHSAGASPGPICYDAGGTEPTVTDANVVLGYLNPDALAGGSVPIDSAAARRAFERDVAPALHCDVHEAAFGVYRLANITMMRAVKAVSTYRGRDPRDFTLFAFGGNGGIHAVALARELQMKRVVVPPAAGVFSAVGLLFAPFEVARSAAFLKTVDANSVEALAGIFRALQADVLAELADPAAAITWRADVRYAGQAFELPVDVPADMPLGDALSVVRARFEAEHERTYGHRLADTTLTFVTLRVIGSIAPRNADHLAVAATKSSGAPKIRPVYFGAEHGLLDTPVVTRGDLAEATRAGPLIVEEYEGTTVVPPDAVAELDAHGNLVIELVGGAASIAATTRLDPILLEVLKNGFEAVADEMALILMRTAHSPIVRDAMDYSTALCDPLGQTIAQGLTTPMHLGSFYDAMRHLIRQFEGQIAPGDIFIGNDPYLASGQHLPDIYIIEPIFAGRRLCGWATTIAHHADVGGLVPGSNSIGATEIHQEGLRLPFLKLVEGGVENAMLMQIVAANVRVPDQVIGDLRAQMAAARAGRRGMAALLDRYGADTVLTYADALQDYAETLARRAISEIPDGTYVFVDHIDGLGENPVPIELHVALTVAGSEVTADWTGTSEQVQGGINAPLSFCKSNVFAALRSIMSADVPNCHGYTRPIKVTAPEGTLVNATYPAPCGARGITGYRIIDCIFGALAAALPDKIAADGTGGSTLPSFGGKDGDRRFVFSECVMGTWGATSVHDGQSGVPHMGSNQSNVPIEMIEADYPIRIERYGFVADTGGPGTFRGGTGIEREYRALADGMYFGVRSDKGAFPPHGLFGGVAGSPSVNLVNPGRNQRRLPSLPMLPVTLGRGDVFRHVMAGGGGYGDPLQRDPARVRTDVLDGLVSAGQALGAYGVVLAQDHEATVDAEATASLRRDRAGAPERHPIVVAVRPEGNSCQTEASATDRDPP